LLSSHVLGEVETLADRLSIIRDGALVRTGTLTELRGHARTAVRAVLDRVPDDAALTLLHDVLVDGDRISATIESDRAQEAMTLLTAHGIRSLTVEPPSLESLFLRLYEDSTDTGTSSMR
ncbi:MAG: ABC transporter, partial [Dermatophilaceae bacterium]